MSPRLVPYLRGDTCPGWRKEQARTGLGIASYETEQTPSRDRKELDRKG